MKLKKSPNKLIIIIIAVALVAAAVIGAMIIFGTVEEGKEIKYVNIYKHPDKLQYYITDKADFSGLKIAVTYNNGNIAYIDGSNCVITGFDSSKPAESLFINVSYQGVNTGFYVKINPIPVIKPTLVSIDISTLPKTEYLVGEYLNTNGGVITLHYSDGSTHRVNLTNKVVYGFNSSAANDSLILTVKYTENGVTVSTTYTVKVVE